MHTFSRKLAVRASRRGNQAGITMTEIIFGLVVIASLTIFLLPRMVNTLGKTDLELATQEVVGLATAIKQYRRINGNYASISLSELATKGYQINPFSGTNTANVYGVAVVLAPQAQNKEAKLDYSATQDSECQQLKARVENFGTATCAGLKLSLVLK